MFQIFITCLYLAAALTLIAAQFQQRTLGFQISNNHIVVKVNRAGWGTPPPAPPGGWPAPPPPPVGWPAPPPNDCTNPGTPVTVCPNQDDPAQSAYVASTNCECFFQCSNGVPISQPCSSGLYFNPTKYVCDYPASSGCTTTTTTTTTTPSPVTTTTVSTP